MNITRRLWSTTFNCSVPCSDTVPVIAVSSFILFLPVVFYLSSFLHSKQKKRILILRKWPCRALTAPCYVDFLQKLVLHAAQMAFWGDESGVLESTGSSATCKRSSARNSRVPLALSSWCNLGETQETRWIVWIVVETCWARGSTWGLAALLVPHAWMLV